LRRLVAGGERTGRHAALLVALRPDRAAAADLEVEPLAQRVDDRDTDAVQTARNLVRRMLELAAGMQHGEHHLGGGFSRLFVRIDWNATTVVTDRHRAIGMQDDLDRVAEPGERLLDGIVHHLVHEMVQAVGAGIADVHGRALTDRFETFENLDVARSVRLGTHAADTSPESTIHRAAPLSVRRSGDVRNTCSALSISRI